MVRIKEILNKDEIACIVEVIDENLFDDRRILFPLNNETMEIIVKKKNITKMQIDSISKHALVDFTTQHQINSFSEKLQCSEILGNK